ncbi:RNA 2',3'-cyclic phosphodiesterase [Endothiovibrio diazotrophicus]
MRNGEGRRLFFALWPAEAERQALVAATRPAVRACGGRPMRAENLHLTLAFLGDVSGETARCAAQAATTVRGEPFELPFEEYGHFRRPQVLWCGPRETPEPLLRLVERLNAVLRPCGIEPEARPFRAHLTLARKARQSPGEWRMAPLAWRVAAFVLVESCRSAQGARYEVVERFGLG